MVTAALAADLGVTATVAQSMQVIAFFLSDTTTGGTTSNGTTTTNATAVGNAVTPHSPTVTAIYVVRCAELTVELREVDEGSQLQCLCAQLKTRLHRLICVSEQCQARTSQLDGTLTQNAWKTTLLVMKSHVKGFRTETANVMNRGAMFPPTAGRQASHISDTKGRM